MLAIKNGEENNKKRKRNAILVQLLHVLFYPIFIFTVFFATGRKTKKYNAKKDTDLTKSNKIRE